MKKNEKEKRGETEQLHTACSKVHEKDEKRRDERREDATAANAFRSQKDYREMPQMPTRSALKSSKGNITDCDLDSAY